METVKKDLDRNLDIVTVLRRLRMHGMALSTLIDAPTKVLIANTAKVKPIRYANDVNLHE